MLILLLPILLFLSGCESDEVLEESILLGNAKDAIKYGAYNKAAKEFEKIEQNHPLSQHMAEISFEKACAYYKSAEYAKAAAGFESFIMAYPKHAKKNEAQRYLFFCFYSQLTRFDRNYDLLELAKKHGRKYKELYLDDEEFDKAHAKLYHYLVYSNINLMHISLEKSPKQWIQAAWCAATIINEYPESPYAPEAFFRMIEFLLVQEGVGFKKDAIVIYKKLEKLHENSEWVLRSRKLFTQQKLDIGGNLAIGSAEAGILQKA